MQPMLLDVTRRVPPLGGYAAKECPRKTHNDHDPSLDESLQDPPSAGLALRLAKGQEFEDEIEKQLAEILRGEPTHPDPDPAHAALVASPAVGEARWARDGTLNAVFLTGDRSDEQKEAREQATLDAMRVGVRWIWNARFPRDYDNSRTSEPDKLARVGDAPKKSNGLWAYDPIDAKDHKVLEGTAASTPWLVAPLDNPNVESATPADIGKGRPHKKDGMQLAHYTRHLEALGHAREGDERYGLIIGRAGLVLVHDLNAELYSKLDPETGKRTKVSILDIYDAEFSYRIDVAATALRLEDDPSLLPLAGIDKRTECGECIWKTVCADERLLVDHATRIKGVTEAQHQIHAERGVNTVAQVASLDVRAATLVDAGIDVPALAAAARADKSAATDQLLAEATHVDATKTQKDRQVDLVDRLEALGIHDAAGFTRLDPTTAAYSGSRVQQLVRQIDQARVLKTGVAHRNRGVDKVNLVRSTIEPHVDIEDFEGYVYLIGVKAFGRSRKVTETDDHGKVTQEEYRRIQFFPFATWERTPEAEARVFAGWWKQMKYLRNKAKRNRWGFTAYYYTSHETTTFRRLAEQHAGRPGVPSLKKLNEFLDSHHWVDLYPVVTNAVLFPAEDVTLKTVAQLCGHVWDDDDPSGGNSMAWYIEATEHPDEAVREAARQRILTYNEDDCTATYRVCEWLQRHGSKREPGSALPPVEQLDRRFGRRR